MKIKPIVVAILTSSLVIAPLSHAGKKMEEVKAAGTVFASAAAGAAVGGPVGLVVGFIGGSLLGEKQIQNYEKTLEIAEANMSIEQLEIAVDQQDLEIAQLEKKIMKQLEFSVFFATGDDQLSKQDEETLDRLATFLNENPEFSVRLDGHADPRGSDEYNNVLSSERANTVAQNIEEAGIDAERLESFGHGSSFSLSAQGDLSAYATERKVDIKLVDESQTESVASNP